MRGVRAGTVLAPVVCVVVALGDPATAAPAVPGPTVTITTTVQGQALPTSPMRGSWDVTRPGRAAKLTVSGAVASGTVTTVTATWTSGWRRTPVHRPSLEIGLSNDFADLAPPTGDEKNGQTIRVRLRTRHHPWQDMGGVVFDRESGVLDFGGMGMAGGIGLLGSAVVQWQVTMTAHFYDTSQETLVEQVKVN